VAGSAAEVLAQLEQRGEGTSLLPGFIAMVLMLAVVEALLANRYRPAAASSGRIPAVDASGVLPVSSPAATASRPAKAARPEDLALAALESSGGQKGRDQ